MAIMARAKFWMVQQLGRIASEVIPEHVLGRLSGLGEAPQFGNRIVLGDIQRAYETARWGETYYKFALFRDMIINDSHIQAEIGKRIMSFVGQHETIEPFDKANADDVQAAEMISDMITNCDNWREGCLHLAGGHIWPIAGCEKIFAPVSESEKHNFRHPVRYRLKKLHPIPYSLFTYRVAYWNLNNAGTGPGEGTTPMPAMTNSGAMPITDGSYSGASALNSYGINFDPDVLVWNPDDWQPDLRFYNIQANGLIDWTLANCYKPDPNRHVLHSANVSTAGMRDNWASVLDSLVPWWFYSKQGADWFARVMERYGSPFAVAYANVTNKTLFDQLTKAFNQATKVNALIVPPQAKIDLKECNYTSIADAHAKFIDVCNTEKTKALLGQVLSTAPKSTGLGSGVADLQGEVRSDWCIYDQKAFAKMEQAQIFEQYLRINGCRGRVPKCYRSGMTVANQSLKARTLRDLSQAGVFPDESAQEDLSREFGMKLRIIDMPALQLELKNAGSKNREEQREAA